MSPRGRREAPSPRTVLKAGGRHKASRLPTAQARLWRRLALGPQPLQERKRCLPKASLQTETQCPAHSFGFLPSSDRPQDNLITGLKTVLTDVLLPLGSVAAAPPHSPPENRQTCLGPGAGPGPLQAQMGCP